MALTKSAVFFPDSSDLTVAHNYITLPYASQSIYKKTAEKLLFLRLSTVNNFISKSIKLSREFPEYR